MSAPRVAPYGEWRSPITADMIVSKSIGFSSPQIDGSDITWIEGRPSEAGRSVIVRRRGGVMTDVTPAPFNARTRVHEYGGGGYLARDGEVYFSNFTDQHAYRLDGNGAHALGAAANAGVRFAAYQLDARRNRLIAVVEDHSDTSASQPANYIGAIDLTTGAVTKLAHGNDFYASPCSSPDGTRLAWLTWNHPKMPWDGTELWVADVDERGGLAGHRRIAGSNTLSIFQPRWSPVGELTFVSEATGWWNLRCLRRGRVTRLTHLAAELGRPLWNLDASSYAFIADETIICCIMQRGTARLALVDTKTRELTELESPYTTIDGLEAANGRAVFIGSSPSSASAIVTFDLASRRFEVVKRSSDVAVEQGFVSIPQAIEFPTEHGLTAHAFYYPPRNPDFAAPTGALPPVLVKSHGGPTSAAGTALKLGYLYWTSRGIGILDVNYGGSTGYGRAYRQRLNGQWGLVDVDDCVNAARHLVAEGRADGNRLMISGGSAGGFTTLSALAFRDVFKAGASYYGVSDVEALARDTHKFESRYLDSLIGPYPARKDIYVARSPVHFADRISAALLLLQGLEDKVVPPSQSEAMFQAVRAKGVATAYLAFEGEQHGFRRAENIKRALEAELYFYARVFGFSPADPIEPITIENL